MDRTKLQSERCGLLWRWHALVSSKFCGGILEFSRPKQGSMFIQSPVPRSKSLSSLEDVPVALTDGETASFRLDVPSSDDNKGGGQEGVVAEAAAVERINREYRNVTYNRGSRPKPRKSPRPKAAEAALSSQDLLLTTFQTYADTNRPPSPPSMQRSPAKYRRLPTTKPTVNYLVLSPNLTRGLLLPQQNTKGTNAVGGRQLLLCDPHRSGARDCCAIKRPHYREEHTPENLRHLDMGLPKRPNRAPSPAMTRDGCLSRRRGLRIGPTLSSLLRILTIVFSILASTARLATNFASARSLSMWMESPILQLVRVNLAVMQNVFVSIELDFGIPLLLPRKTLDSCKCLDKTRVSLSLA